MTAQAAKKRYGKRGFSRASDAAKMLIRQPLAKRGFAKSRLLTEWDEVVGAEIAGLVRPLRLSHAAKEGMGLKPTSAQEKTVQSAVAPIADDGLRDALERLGRNIATRNTIK